MQLFRDGPARLHAPPEQKLEDQILDLGLREAGVLQRFGRRGREAVHTGRRDPRRFDARSLGRQRHRRRSTGGRCGSLKIESKSDTFGASTSVKTVPSTDDPEPTLD